jgi:biotin transport system substrate-specific component
MHTCEQPAGIAAFLMVHSKKGLIMNQMTGNILDENRTLSTRDIVRIGLVTAIICVLAPMSIPIGPVPISLTTLVLYFSIYLLGTVPALISCLIYLLLGLAGLPVFSGFTSGPAKIAGPTGGYLLSYFLMILIAGIIISRSEGRKWMELIGMIAGTAVLYTIGTIWLDLQTGMGTVPALMAGVIPFLPGDAVKILLALFFGRKLKGLVERTRH